MPFLFFMLIELFTVLVTIFGVLMSLAYFPQAYQIVRTKSSKDVSLLTYLIFGFGTITWTVYGILLGDLPIIFSFIVGVFGSWLVVILVLRYR